MINKIMDWLKKIPLKRLSLGVVLGAIAGYAYYYFIGCKSGTCAITSSPVISTMYGSVIGFLFAFPTKKKEEK